MLKYFPIQVFILLSGFLLIIPVVPSQLHAFPLRIDEDCFYGEGEPTGEGISTWMGYAIEFEPPYTPYTVDSISIYIDQMLLAPDASRRLRISVLDEVGVRRQFTDIDWRDLEGHTGWVLINLANREYSGPFTVIIHSGIGLSPSVNMPVEAVFRLGVEENGDECVSYAYTSDAPPPPPPMEILSENELAEQGEATRAKLVSASRGISSFAGGNWMIRAQSPGLQTESTHIYITMEDIEALHNRPTIPSPGWHLPPIEGMGPRNTVHCPTSLSGVTFYYWDDERERKFLIPHNGPWAHPDLIGSLGGLCADLAKEGVVGIEHIGIYNDRNIRGTNVKSSHAYGLGIDFSGFQYSDGRMILVMDHDDPEVRSVLEHIRDDYLEKYFTTVLDWTYQHHENHFHVNLPYPH